MSKNQDSHPASSNVSPDDHEDVKKSASPAGGASPLVGEKLRESEERFRALVTATSDVVYVMSPDWKVMYALDGRGFLPDTGEPISDWMDKYIHPEDHAGVREGIDSAIASRSIFQLEHRVVRADGTLGWTFSRAIPVLDEKGAVIEWFGTASDVTARKHTEATLQTLREALEESKRLYEAITGGTPDLIYVFNLNYRFIYANKALLNMWGRSEEDAMGRGLLELGYEPWHAEMHEREIDQVFATRKPIRGEVSFPHATLGKRMYDYIFTPVLNEHNEVVAVAGTTRDISDLKQAEETLKRSEEQFRTLTQSLPQLIWTAGSDGDCDFFNQQWYDYTGSTPRQSLGDGWMQYIHPGRRNLLNNKWRHSMKSGEPIAAEFQLRSAEGVYNWFYVLGNAIKDEEGRVNKWVGALTNIEERKAQEEKLEHLVQQRTLELQRSNADLLQFAHVASHDLKEPVRKVKTFLSRLEADTGSHLSEEAKGYLARIYSATDRMYKMIDGVLGYSTLSNTEQAFTEVDLNQVIKDIETDLEVLIQQKAAQLRYDKLPAFQGAPLLIYQLFYNLVNNSLKFSKKDTPPVITLTSRVVKTGDAGMIQIEVQDNGIGFEVESAERIFNTFTRLHSRDEYEGTGLGLALCKKIVERHGGTLSAVSKENEGARFIITLPVQHEQAG